MKFKIANFKRIILLTFAIIFVFVSGIAKNTYASNEERLEEQQNTFGINSFISNSKKYVDSEFFEENDLKEIFESAVKGKVDNKSIWGNFSGILGKEVKETCRIIGSVLAIIVIHSILKSLSENLENDNISKLIYYVQYILIATIVMANFTQIIQTIRETVINLVGFINLLIPLLTSLMLFTGSITTTSMVQPVILIGVNIVGNLIQNVLIPIVLVIASFSIISKISDKVQIDKITKFMKSGVVWALGIILTIFVSVVSLEGTLSSSVDGVSAKTAKAVVSSAIPIVGKILGDAVDSVLGCGIILKNSVGILGVIIILTICIVPILKLSFMTILYKLLSAICQPIADKKILELLDQIGDVFKILLAILASIAVLIIIGVTLVINISNSGMMYR